ncbi:MAG: polysaccharide deacetylase family protein [Bacteroidota bacterium]|nr:polysaccharide deacetylase family protein [Bacteroidota bacterium]
MRLFIFKVLKLIGLLRILRHFKKDKITVLCFHRVSDEYSPSWPPLQKKVFEQILSYIERHYTVINISDINRISGKNSKPLLIITFDDGYKDIIKNVYPLLNKYNFKANINITIDPIEKGEPIWTQKLNKILEEYLKKGLQLNFKSGGKSYKYNFTNANFAKKCAEIFLVLLKIDEISRNYLINTFEKEINDYEFTEVLSWKDTLILQELGYEIGSHTFSHRNLCSVETGNLEYELKNSKQLIEEKINSPIDIIAFPNGQFNDKILKLSIEYGYKYLLLIEESTFDYKKQFNNKYFVIPRILINHDSFIENCFKIEGFHRLITKIKKKI